MWFIFVFGGRAPTRILKNFISSAQTRNHLEWIASSVLTRTAKLETPEVETREASVIVHAKIFEEIPGRLALFEASNFLFDDRVKKTRQRTLMPYRVLQV